MQGAGLTVRRNLGLNVLPQDASAGGDNPVINGQPFLPTEPQQPLHFRFGGKTV